MRDSVMVADCSIGRGLFAERSFDSGELILHLGGPRYDRAHPIHGTEFGANLLQTGRKTYIMLSPPGVFANHSCNPNAGIVRNRQLVAIRPIPHGDEIRFDYSTTMDEDFWTMDCCCGEENCRGVISDFKDLPPLVRANYLKLGVVQGFIARKFHK